MELPGAVAGAGAKEGNGSEGAMPFVEWRDEFSVGVEAFDRDHKRLFSLLNKVHGAVRAGKSPEIVARILAALNIYVNFHFSEKEALFLRANYPGYEVQQREHRVFSAMLEEIRQDFENAASERLPRQVLETLKDWLCVRNIKADRAFAEYLSRAGGAL